MDSTKDRLEPFTSPANHINVPNRSCEGAFMEAENRMQQPVNYAQQTASEAQAQWEQRDKDYGAIASHNRHYLAGGKTFKAGETTEY